MLSNGKIRLEVSPFGGGSARSLLNSMSVPNTAKGGKLGESKAVRPEQSTFTARFPLSRRSLKKIQTFSSNLPHSLRVWLYFETSGVLPPVDLRVQPTILIRPGSYEHLSVLH